MKDPDRVLFNADEQYYYSGEEINKLFKGTAVSIEFASASTHTTTIIAIVALVVALIALIVAYFLHCRNTRSCSNNNQGCTPGSPVKLNPPRKTRKSGRIFPDQSKCFRTDRDEMLWIPDPFGYAEVFQADPVEIHQDPVEMSYAIFSGHPYQTCYGHPECFRADPDDMMRIFADPVFSGYPAVVRA